METKGIVSRSHRCEKRLIAKDKPMTTITLSIAPHGLFSRVWIAEFSGPEAEEIRRSCGTTRIPTAFTAHCPAEKVKAKIQELNPLADVIIEES